MPIKMDGHTINRLRLMDSAGNTVEKELEEVGTYPDASEFEDGTVLISAGGEWVAFVLTDALDGKIGLSSQLGAANANKVLATDENGAVVLMEQETIEDMPIDSAPLEGSTHPVSSNGVFAALKNILSSEAKGLLIEILRDIANGDDPTDGINRLELLFDVGYQYNKTGNALQIEAIPRARYTVSNGVLTIV